MTASLDPVLAYALSKMDTPNLIAEEQRWAIQAALEEVVLFSPHWSLTPAITK